MGASAHPDGSFASRILPEKCHNPFCIHGATGKQLGITAGSYPTGTSAIALRPFGPAGQKIERPAELTDAIRNRLREVKGGKTAILSVILSR
jgi:hypothetical protein